MNWLHFTVGDKGGGEVMNYQKTCHATLFVLNRCHL